MFFFDLPGTVNTSRLLNTLAGMHHIFSPITAAPVVMESTLSNSKVLTNILMKQGQTSIETIRLFWHQVDGREKSHLYATYGNVNNKTRLQGWKLEFMIANIFEKNARLLQKLSFKPFFTST